MSDVASAIASVNANVLAVHRELNSFQQSTLHSFASVERKQDVLENELQDFYNQFIEFVKADLRQKKLQLAETRVGNLKQDLQIKFGYYAEVRRMANGILQGVDSGIISEETIKSTTEEVMIKAPKYWLAPTLVCISSWISNNREIAEKALEESLKRDDYKTTLFFMLVMKRLNRMQATQEWVERYFSHQDPKKLSREFILVLEGIVTGVFPPASKSLMMNNIQSWIDILASEDNFIERQVDTWNQYFYANRPGVNEKKYTLLRTYCTNWNEIEEDLRNVYSNEYLNIFFTNILKNSETEITSIKDNLDKLLTFLVTNFDDEELPLQKDVRLNELIIEHQGDEDEAKSRMKVENDIYSEEVDFLRLLTNAAFSPEASGGSRVTQSLAVSISQPWIMEASKKFIASYRLNQNKYILFKIDGWEGKTENGANEDELSSQQNHFYENLRNEQLEANKTNFWALIIGFALGCIMLFNNQIQTAIICFVIGIAIHFYSKNLVDKKRVEINEKIDQSIKTGQEILRGVLAEVVDLKTELFIEDAKSQKLHKLIGDITPSSFTSVSAGVSRNIIN